MISFRYHLVSVVAVFLALAVGIVVGTTALSGPITRDLRSQVGDTKQQRDALAAQVDTLQTKVGDANEFAATYGTQLVAHKLSGTGVVVIVLPGATSGMQNGISRQVSAAGGHISGTVTLTQDYLDRQRGTGINSLATGPAHPIELTLPETSDAAKLGGALLSYVLLGKGEQTDVTAVLGGLSQLHMVSLDGNDVTPSRSVVVLGHGSMAANGYPGAAELALVSALGHGGGHVVVAADPASAAGGGLVAQIRAGNTVRAAVSTVDDADSAFGQVSAVLALADADQGQVGHYGTEDGSDALFPTPNG